MYPRTRGGRREGRSDQEDQAKKRKRGRQELSMQDNVIQNAGLVFIESQRGRKKETGSGWCVVLLMRYLGIVWHPGYPREQVGALRPPIVSKGRPGQSFQ